METILLIIILVAVLAVLILVHEFGHFIVAKRNGIRVDEFGFGFPPRAKKLFHWKGTDFTLNWIPFGGFVRIFGENPADPELSGSKPKDSFIAKSRWTQARVLLAGVFFNILLAWFLFALSFVMGVPAIVSSSNSLYRHMESGQELVITDVLQESPASKAGLVPGDIVSNISEAREVREYPNLDDFAFSGFIKNHPNELLTIQYTRDGRENSVALKPVVGVLSQDFASIGVATALSGNLQLSVPRAIWQGGKSTVKVFFETTRGLASIIGGIFTSNDTPVLEQVSGPIGIAGIVQDSMSEGFTSILMLVAIISVNLAVLNLVPFPALDGGRLLILIVEGVRKKTVSPKIVMWINAVGFFVLIGLMVVVTISDIIKL
ncbi:MAG: regulator of sigma E protease [Candidatus Paceibacteria bacterium]|jgi:regulator of sigma E protease